MALNLIVTSLGHCNADGARMEDEEEGRSIDNCCY